LALRPGPGVHGGIEDRIVESKRKFIAVALVPVAVAIDGLQLLVTDIA